MVLLHYSQRARALAFDTSNMNHVANATKADQDTMLLLARAAKKDSEMMKLIAFISVLYLPSSLITVRLPLTPRKWQKEPRRADNIFLGSFQHWVCDGQPNRRWHRGTRHETRSYAGSHIYCVSYRTNHPY